MKKREEKSVGENLLFCKIKPTTITELSSEISFVSHFCLWNYSCATSIFTLKTSENSQQLKNYLFGKGKSVYSNTNKNCTGPGLCICGDYLVDIVPIYVMLKSGWTGKGRQFVQINIYG